MGGKKNYSSNNFTYGIGLSMQEEQASRKRTNAQAFGESATVSTGEISSAVALFAAEHATGCEGLRGCLAEAEAAAQAATGALSKAAEGALKEVNGVFCYWGGVGAGFA